MMFAWMGNRSERRGAAVEPGAATGRMGDDWFPVEAAGLGAGAP